jgi:tetratricopeptide (TPR) repeat protein
MRPTVLYCAAADSSSTPISPPPSKTGFPEIVAAQPALLAHHYQEAGLTEKAVECWLAAGRQAWGRSAVAEAVALLRRGMALVPALPDSDRRRETELDLQIAFGQALIASQGWGAPKLGDVHSRTRDLALALNRPRALLSALWGQFTGHWARADLKQARRFAAELRELGETTCDVPMQVMGCDAGGLARFHLGKFTGGRASLEKALALYDPADRGSYSELLSQDVLVFLLTHFTWLLACLGHVDQALLQRDAALEEARRLSHPPTLAFALSSGAWVTGAIIGLHPGSLLLYADEELALATEHGLGFYRMGALGQRGWCLAALGHMDQAIPLLTASLAGRNQLGFRVFKPWLVTLLGDACRMDGQWQSALDHFAVARRLAGETGERCRQVETLRLTGEVLLAQGDRAGAEAQYHEALAIARQQSARVGELCVAMSLARLWRDQGKCLEACALLAPVYGWFTEGFGTPLLQEAKALLDELA